MTASILKPLMSKQEQILFLVSGIVWLFLGLFIIAMQYLLQPAAMPGGHGREAFWLFIFWVLAFCDLLGIVGVAKSAFTLSAAETEKRTAAVIRTFYWGFFKLICLGAIIATLVFVDVVSKFSVFFGLSTLVAVPLLGGVWWSIKVLKDAR